MISGLLNASIVFCLFFSLSLFHCVRMSFCLENRPNEFWNWRFNWKTLASHRPSPAAPKASRTRKTPLLSKSALKVWNGKSSKRNKRPRNWKSNWLNRVWTSLIVLTFVFVIIWNHWNCSGENKGGPRSSESQRERDASNGRALQTVHWESQDGPENTGPETQSRTERLVTWNSCSSSSIERERSTDWAPWIWNWETQGHTWNRGPIGYHSFLQSGMLKPDFVILP